MPQSWVRVAVGIAAAATFSHGTAWSASSAPLPSSIEDSALVGESAVALPGLPQPSQLLAVDVPSQSSMRFWVDFRSISVEPNGDLRYTMVVQGGGGARSASYEGLRCRTLERRVFAIESTGQWQLARGSLSEWHSLRGISNPGPIAFASQFGCDGKVPHRTVDILRRLKQGGERLPP